MKIALDNVFEGRTVTIVGGGPSLLGYNFESLKQPVIVCNYIVKHVDSEMVVCIDAPVTEKYDMGKFLDGYHGHKICLNNLTERDDFIQAEIIPDHKALDLDWHIKKVNLTGFFALAIALRLGAEMIFLLGFDGGYDDPAFPDWYPERYVGPGMNTFFNQNEYYRFFSEEKIINVGATSRIDSFPKVSLYTEFYKKDYHELLRTFNSRQRMET